MSTTSTNGTHTHSFTPTAPELRVVFSASSPFSLAGLSLLGQHTDTIIKELPTRLAYRYGFNGMEKDDELKGSGNSYDFGARMYDSRLGRWFKMDNKFKLLPSISPYSFANNNPIYYIDKDGNVIEPADEKSKTDYNTSVSNIFTGNAVATKLFTITSELNSLTNISREDLFLALNATESFEQRAVILTLSMAVNSKTTYTIKSLTPSPQSIKVDFVQGYESRQEGDRVDIVVSLQEALQENQIGDAVKNIENTYITGRVNENRASKGEIGSTKRDADAMLFASIGASFMAYDPSMNSPQLFEYGGDIQLSAIQFENIIMRLKGKESLSGTDFKRPNGVKLTSEMSRYVDAIPNQIQYSLVHFTTGIEILDKVSGNSVKNTQENYNNIDRQDAP